MKIILKEQFDWIQIGKDIMNILTFYIILIVDNRYNNNQIGKHMRFVRSSILI